MMEVRMDNSFSSDASFGVSDARGCYWSVAHNSFPVVAGKHYYKVSGFAKVETYLRGNYSRFLASVSGISTLRILFIGIQKLMI